MANHPNRNRITAEKITHIAETRSVTDAEIARLSDSAKRQLLKRASPEGKYRISEGEVHFYGQMPNTNKSGWFFAAWSPEECIGRLLNGN